MKYFYDNYGVTWLSFLIIAIVGLILMIISINSYTRWQCNNYEIVTGFEVKYIDYDECYIKNTDGIFIRYDAKYKSVK